MDWRYGSSSRAPALQAQSPDEFKRQSQQQQQQKDAKSSQPW
jgi:hypothetical protein